MPATPLRQLTTTQHPDGYRVLSMGRVSYADGAEQRLLEIVRSVEDRSCASDELAIAATDWAEQYHLSRARANFLRGLSFPIRGPILEIGAGCGAITRYLGELGEQVDALEPVEARAAVARTRTEDLGNVEVFVGDLDDVPEERVYQSVLVVGVLEWIAGGAPLRERYLEFLRGIERRLTPGGLLICAIENQLGVKYLAGAPEDHSGVPFDGVEGYPFGAPARTFSRRELTALMSEAGFAASFMHAFPDYKMTHTLFADEIFDEPALQRVVRDAPPMPSIDRGGGGRRPLDELRCWETLCAAGLGREVTNSFVVIGTPASSAAQSDGDQAPNSLATFVSTEHRVAAFGVCTRLERDSSGGFVFRRSLIETDAAAPPGAVKHLISDMPLVHGDHFRHAFPTASDVWEDGIRRWADLVWGDDYTAGGDFDLLPRNLLITDEGEIRSIDREWRHPDWGPKEILGRGFLYEIPRLAAGLRLSAESRDDTIQARVLRVGQSVGLDPSAGWLDEAMRRERLLHAELQGRDPDHPAFIQQTLDWRAWLDLLLRTELRPPEPAARPFRRRLVHARVRRLVGGILRSR